MDKFITKLCFGLYSVFWVIFGQGEHQSCVGLEEEKEGQRERDVLLGQEGETGEKEGR